MTLQAELAREVLGFTESERMSVGYAGPGIAWDVEVHDRDATLARLAELPDTYNVYYGVNPVGHVDAGGRGDERAVTRLTALVPDLDVKADGCASFDVARAITAEIGIALGVRESAVVMTGHGLQPYWPISDGHVIDGDISRQRALVRCFGRLAAAIAGQHGAKIDKVFDLARMLRAADTFNCKGAEPIPVVFQRGPGGPLSMAEAFERLAERGIEPHADDELLDLDVVAAPEDWPVGTTCTYVTAMVNAWRTDTPAARNPWAYGQLIRLACALRAGCICREDFDAAVVVLTERLAWLVANTGTPRPMKRYELVGALSRAIDIASRKSDDAVAAELGHHRHDRAGLDVWGNPIPVVGVEPTVPAPLVVDVVEDQISARMALLRVDREARRRLEIEEHPPKPKPPITSLTSLLAEPDESDQYRIAEVLPEGGRTMLEAQHKAGKTTLADNLTRSLADGDLFLGRFAVSRTVSALVRIDLEMPKNKVRRWLREQGIVNTDAVADVICLRGKVSSFNIGDPHGRREWAAQFRDLGCDFLIFDCIRPWMDAFGLDENRDAGRFIDPFNELLDDAGIENAVVIHHMGHGGERARGDSRFKDWPDAAWKLVRESDDPTSPRYFSAMGRDVQVAEGRLTLTGRRLTYTVGSRGDTATETAYTAIIKLLAGSEPMHGRDIEANLVPLHPQKSVRAALRLGVERDTLRTAKGAHRAVFHSIAYPCAECGLPVASRALRHQSCAVETSGGVE